MEARTYADDTICVYGYFEQERLSCLITQSVEAPHNGICCQSCRKCVKQSVITLEEVNNAKNRTRAVRRGD